MIVLVLHLIRKGRMVSTGVIVMAGGKGERLLPSTLHTPKPLIKVRGTPMLDYSLQPATSMTNKIAVTAYHLAPQVDNYVRHKFPSVVCMTERRALHTGGSLKWNRALIDSWEIETLVVLMGDHARRASLEDLVQAHTEATNDATLIACPPERQHNQIALSNNKAIAYLKSGLEPIPGALASTGEYVFKWSALREWLHKAPGTYFGVGWGLLAPMMASPTTQVGAYDFGEWWDLGTWDRIKSFEERGWDI